MDTNNPNTHIECQNCGETVNAELIKFDNDRGVSYCEFCAEAYWIETLEAEDPTLQI